MTTKTNTKESGFEEFIEKELVNLHGYRSRPNSSYNKELCMDTELVLEFIQTTQKENWNKLVEQYGDEAPDRFLARLDEELLSRGSLSVLREGVTDRGVRIRLAYFKPENDKNPETLADYAGNVLSVMRQVKYSAKNENSLDMVIFVNGLPLFTTELKNQFTGQNVINAISQYKTDRDQKEKLLSIKAVTILRLIHQHLLVSTKPTISGKISGPRTASLICSVTSYKKSLKKRKIKMARSERKRR